MRKLLLFLCFLLLAITSYAQSSCESVTSNTHSVTADAFGQSVTMSNCIGGYFHSFVFDKQNNTNNLTATIQIFDGQSFSNADEIYSQTGVSIPNGTGDVTIVFSGGTGTLAFTGGNQYTILISSSNTVKYGFYFNSGNNYAGGKELSDGFFYDNSDLYFDLKTTASNPLSPVTAFNLTGGGASCDGTGVAVGLDGSEAGVSYQLQRDGSNVGLPVLGTGNAISFGNQTISGTYTVVGTLTADNCSIDMAGSAAVIAENSTSAPSVSISGTAYDGGASTFTATPTLGGDNPTYQWQLNGSNVGSNSSTLTQTVALNDVVSVTMTSDYPCAFPTTATDSKTITSLETVRLAMDFDGVNDRIELPSSAAVTGTTSRTVEAWIKTSASGTGSLRFISWGTNGGGNSFTMRLDNGKLRVEFANGNMVGHQDLRDGKWHHVVVVLGTHNPTKIEDFKLYVDGEPVDNPDVGNPSNTISTQPSKVKIGVGLTNNHPFLGQIDEVRIWNTARTIKEIRDNMFHKLTGTETGLVAYYPFDNVSTANGTTDEIVDASSNNNDGETHNMDNSDLVISTAFVVSGTTEEASGHQNASKTFNNGVVIDDTNDPFDGSQNLFVTEVNEAPNSRGGISEANIESKYYIINNYDNGGSAGTFNVSLTLPTTAPNGSSMQLYRREDGATGNWTAITTGTANNGSVTYTGLTTFSQYISATQAVFPVEMLSFNARPFSGYVLLDWQTATEKNNEGFDIQRSTDGKTWETIGFVQGRGTTQTPQSYAYTDEAPLAGTSYYRLKQVDYNGAFEYSNILSVNYDLDGKQQGLKLFPNPVSDELNILNGEGVATIYNALGQPVRELIINNLQLMLLTCRKGSMCFLFSKRMVM